MSLSDTFNKYFSGGSSVRTPAAIQRLGVYTAQDRAESMALRTGLGMTYGGNATDAQRVFASKHEPVAGFIVLKVGSDIWKNWFKIDDSRTGGPDPKLNEAVQAQLTLLNARDVFKKMTVYERLFGWSVIVLGLPGEYESPIEVDSRKGLAAMAAYPPSAIGTVEEGKTPEDERYELPEYYVFNNTGGKTRVHWSRIELFSTRLLDHKWKGLGVLDLVMDDILVLRNMKWGMGQTIYRYGSGFPDVSKPDWSQDDIDAWIAEGYMEDIHSRSGFAHDSEMNLEFKGVAGVALNPKNYYDPILENISIGSGGIPVTVLRGAQAGALTGSELNDQQYWSVVAAAQTDYEPGIKRILDIILRDLNEESNYVVNWVPGFEVSEKTKAETELLQVRTKTERLRYMTPNEVRTLDPPPEVDKKVSIEGGDKLGSSQSSNSVDAGVEEALRRGKEESGLSAGDQMSHSHNYSISGDILGEKLRDVLRQFIQNQIGRVQAEDEGVRIINEFCSDEEKRALEQVQKRLGRYVPLSPELESQLRLQRERYIEDFKHVLDDAEKLRLRP